jgi:uncharacterized protein (DUF1697 family)
MHVALLRGINVGTAKRVAMADLRDLLAGLGYADVRTLLNSGNAVFATTATGARTASTRIEQALVKRLGIASRVIVFSADELRAVIAANRLVKLSNNPSRLMVGFLASAGHVARVEPLIKQDWGAERLGLGPRVVYFWIPEGFAKSALSAAVGKALGDAVTVRNWATVLKLEAMVAARDKGDTR